MRNDIFVYLSGPLTAKDGFTQEENCAAGAAIFWDLVFRGVPAFSPHLCGSPPETIAISHERWLAYDFAVIDRCTHMLMLPRWETSDGAVRERAYAKSRRMRVYDSVREFTEAQL